MSNYAFTFKKDDIFVEFVTTDRDVVEKQFQIWVADADEYSRTPHKQFIKPLKETNIVVKQAEPEAIDIEPQIEQTPIDSEPTPATQVPEAIEEAAETTVPVIIEAMNEESIQQTAVAPEIIQEELPTVDDKTPEIGEIGEFAEPAESLETIAVGESAKIEIPEIPEVFDKASSLLKTINTIQNPPNEDKTTEPTVNFEDVLDKSIENPTFEPGSNKDQVFLSFVKSKNTNDKFHYLIITAYYLSEFGKLERFSLKQINSKLMQNLSELIDHTTLQEAINQQLIEVVPDFTGTSEVAEYRLTNLGEEFFVKI